MEKKQRKRVGAIRNYKRVSCTLTLSVHRDLKIGDGDGDGNENVKKAIGLISDGSNNFACAAHFFLYICLPFLQDYDVKLPNSMCYGERKQATTKFSFSF